jgi:hypothetical protein
MEADVNGVAESQDARDRARRALEAVYARGDFEAAASR